MNNNNNGIEERIEEEYGRASGQDSQPKDSNPDDSKGGSEQITAKTYTIPGQNNADGTPKQFTAEQVVEETKRLQAENTRIAQENSKLKKSQENGDADTQNGRKITTSGNKLSPEDQATREYLRSLGFPTKDEADKIFSEKEPEIATKVERNVAARQMLNSALTALEKDFDGGVDSQTGVVKPKVDGEKVREFIRENPGLSTVTPVDLARIVYKDDFEKYDRERFSKAGGKPPLPKTEGSGAGLNGNSQTPAPHYNFRDGSAEAAAHEILDNA